MNRLVQIAEADTAETAWDLAVAYFTGLGLSRVNYGFTRFRSLRTIGDPDDVLFLTNGGDAYRAAYFRSGFFATTPAFRWAQANSGATTWTRFQQAYDRGDLAPEEALAIERNRAAGVIAGISVSFPETSSRAKGALGLTAEPTMSHADVDALFAQNHAEILAVAHMMHLKLIQLPFSNQRRPLTQRQREALEWVADGKTTQDVAMLMQVSAAMIEKHLRLARETLCVDTTAQAIAKAALMNLIFNQQNQQVMALAK